MPMNSKLELIRNQEVEKVINSIKNIAKESSFKDNSSRMKMIEITISNSLEDFAQKVAEEQIKICADKAELANPGSKRMILATSNLIYEELPF